MANNIGTIQIPIAVYNDLQELASIQGMDAVRLLQSLLKVERQRLELKKNWRELKKDAVRTEHAPVTETVDELVERLRKTRDEIFETEYAHLYR